MKSKIILFVVLLLGASVEFSGCKKEEPEQKASTGGSTGSTGSITALNCGTATNVGTLTVGIAATGVSSSISYTGGNGGAHSGQTVTSTGVTGLTASLAAGTFATGTGNLTYSIAGTPSAAGTASFALNIGGQTCILNRTVNTGGNPGSTASCGATNVHNSSLTYGSMTDQDGNTYKTIIIEAQEIMAENLKASHYRNGDLIPVVTSNTLWPATIGSTCWYNNDSATYACPYGKLYNWYAVADSRNVCPIGWHVPSYSEMYTLVDSLGGQIIAGGKMKSIGTQYWMSPNTAATNSSGFSGLPGGLRSFDGTFSNMEFSGDWWCSTDISISSSYCLSMGRGFSNGELDLILKSCGFSVRCFRD